LSIEDAAGTIVHTGSAFLYSIELIRRRGGLAFNPSSDLFEEQGDAEQFSDGDVFGFRHDAFEGFRLLPSIPPGGRMLFSYRFGATGSTETPETGYQAFVGDPFNIASSGGRFEIGLTDGTPSPGGGADESAVIPEPASILLVSGGLLASLLAGRGRRRRLS
jgi:hypothetical protein